MHIDRLKGVKHLTIDDIISFSPTMKLSIKDAIPNVTEFKKIHDLDDGQIKDVCQIIKEIGLYL